MYTRQAQGRDDTRAESRASFDAYYELLKRLRSGRDCAGIHQEGVYHQEILRHFASKGDAVLSCRAREGAGSYRC